MLFNISKNANLTIKVMEMSLKTEFRTMLNQPVKLMSVSNCNGTYFYCEKYGSTCVPVSYELSFPINTYIEK